MTSALRFLLLAWAGGILLWTASYWIMDREETAWFARDTLLLNIMPEDRGYYHIEEKIISRYTDHLNTVLASENTWEP